MHSPHVNLHRPFGDVSGLEREGSAEDEVPCVSHCGQQTFFGHNESTLIQYNLCGSSRAVVNNSDCHSGFGKGKTAYSGGTTGGNPTHGFQIYDNTSFQAKGSIPYNIEPSCLAYTETARTYSLGPATRKPVHVFQTYENMLFQTRGSNLRNIQGTYLPYSDCRQSHQLERTMHPLASKGQPCKRKADMPVQGIMLQAKRGRGGHTEQQQRNVGGGEGNSHYANEMCYLYSDDASFDLESPMATHEASDAQGMYYSPMPLPMNERLSHSRNAQENDQGTATSSSMLQPEMRDPAVVTNVADSSAYRGEDQHLRFQTGAVRPQRNSRRRTSNYTSTTTVNGEGLTPAYIDIGDADWRCHWCGAAFWFGERLKSSRGSRVRYGRCCGEGKDGVSTCHAKLYPRPQTRDTGKILELKVYRIWASRNPPDTTETGYRAILLDRHGDAIQANMDADDIHHFKPILIPGQAIRVSDFECTPTDKWQRTLENPTSLSFTRPTKIDAIPAESFPNHYFHFTSNNQLPTKVWDPRDKGIKDYPVLTGEAGNIGNPTTNQSRIRKVEIQNLNRISIELTLWDDLADKFEKQEIKKLERPIIIAVTSCRVTKFLKRDLQLSSTPAMYYYINPNIPDLQQYKAAYQAFYEEKKPLCVTRYRLNDTEQEQQKTVSHSSSFSSTKQQAISYNFRATLTDGTGSATFIFFTPKADEFIGVNCGDLVASHKGPQRGQFPKEIEAIVGTNHMLQFHYNTTSNPGVTEFVMDEVFGVTDKPKQIDSNPSGLDSLPKALPAPTPELKVQTTTEGTEHGDSSKGTTGLPKIEIVQTKGDTTVTEKQGQTPTKQEQHILPQTQTKQGTTVLPKIEIVQTKGDTTVLEKEENIPAKQEQHTLPQTQTKQETTPPEAASVAMQTRSKTEMEPNVAPKTVKRRIFTEEPSESKKKGTRRHSTPTIFCDLDADFLAALKKLPTM
ncbi:nucleic acid-binding, OB-fold protein [Artemisia annua]|uniref:Nucleic acid-binding, OB-fold protein n=1 Tax=Artemisia annua TaxID=35608 RepID=A0A2U1MVH7_ARTAN|nr:nucleic acid-binding, OB-fold protein [Artemisia annua]